MKRFMMTVALSCALSGLALAGDVPTVGVTGPTPNGTPQNNPASQGQIPTVGFSDQTSVAALNLIQTLLGLL